MQGIYFSVFFRGFRGHQIKKLAVRSICLGSCCHLSASRLVRKIQSFLYAIDAPLRTGFIQVATRRATDTDGTNH